MISLYFKNNAQTFENQTDIETNLCVFRIETRFLRLILIFLLAGFHQNTSKSQPFSILNCFV